jgi:c-di-GMP-binding flagellar brake protein YcgR
MQHSPVLLQTSTLQMFIEKTAAGFGVTPLQAAIAGLVVIGFAGFLIWYSRRQKRREQELHYRRAEELYQKAVRRLGLSSADEALIDSMAAYLNPPLHKLDLLSNARLFDRCSRLLRSAGAITEDRIAELRSRLGLRPVGPEGIPSSTAELAPNLGLQIKSGSRNLRGSIAEQSRRTLAVRIEPSEEAGRPGLPSPGEHVRVYFQLSTGIYSFSSQVLRRRADTVELQHSGELRREQRRRYFRRKLRIPVFVTAASTGGEPAASTMYDLGGGGASLRNPRGLVKEEEEIELSFAPAGERYRIPARVIRISRRGRVLHAAFTSIPEAVRDRIIGSLFTSPARPGNNPPEQREDTAKNDH